MITRQAILEWPEWQRAATAAERLRLSGAAGTVPGLMRPTAGAPERLEKWQRQPPFAGRLFEQRLAAAGFTLESFSSVLQEPIQSVHARALGSPDWAIAIADAFAHHTNPRDCSDHPPLPPAFCEAHGFLHLIEPLARRGWHRLHATVKRLQESHQHLPFDVSTVGSVLLDGLPGRLVWMLKGPLIIDIQFLRVSGALQGEDPEARFRDYVGRLREPQVALELLREYPVLARQIVLCIDQWVDGSAEFLERLCADWPAIRQGLAGIEDPGPLMALDQDAGDRHAGGRSVSIARFRNDLRLVYKPRPVAVEAHFQDVLRWLNDAGVDPQFRTLTILERGAYGWVEYAEAVGCTSRQEITRFYERMGGLVALLYALAGTDVHFENLIAAGEHPVIVDLESLLQPSVTSREAGSSDLARSVLESSVLRTGILPGRERHATDNADVDLSALGAENGQAWPFQVLTWKDEETDEIEVGYTSLTIDRLQNRPLLNGELANPVEYADALLDGFRAVYRCLLTHRDALVIRGGLLERFAADEVRVILRPTHVYSFLLQGSFHPDLLEDALDRDLFFDQLWMAVEQRHELARVVIDEQAELLVANIPRFYTRPGSRDLWSSTHVRFERFFAEPALTTVHDRLDGLGESDLDRQAWLLRASLASLVRTWVRPQRWSGVSDTTRSADAETLLRAAAAVGDRLAGTALRGNAGTTWFGLSSSPFGFGSPGVLDGGLYDGVAGIVLFLAHLGRLTGEGRYTQLAESALLTVFDDLDTPGVARPCGFGGLGGIIYLLAHLGVVWQRDELFQRAEAALVTNRERLERVEEFDILGGAAGAIAGLLVLHEAHRSDRALAEAVRQGERLLAGAVRTDAGIGWLGRGNGTVPLAGFSHGAGGVAMALLRLFSTTRDERFHQAACEAIAYERSLYSVEARNWPDLRQDRGARESAPDEPAFQCAWCHGAPGVGLARLGALSVLDNPDIAREIETAVETTIREGFGSNHSLCHGDLGNLELLLRAAIERKDTAGWVDTYRFAGAVLTSIDEHGWLCGVPLGIETPGLMTGLAGIGYGLLRLADPASVPAVLTIDPPAMVSA